jgi:hypothetical protein
MNRTDVVRPMSLCVQPALIFSEKYGETDRGEKLIILIELYNSKHLIRFYIFSYRSQPTLGITVRHISRRQPYGIKVPGEMYLNLQPLLHNRKCAENRLYVKVKLSLCLIS